MNVSGRNCEVLVHWFKGKGVEDITWGRYYIGSNNIHHRPEPLSKEKSKSQHPLQGFLAKVSRFIGNILQIVSRCLGGVNSSRPGVGTLCLAGDHNMRRFHSQTRWCRLKIPGFSELNMEGLKNAFLSLFEPHDFFGSLHTVLILSDLLDDRRISVTLHVQINW